MIGGISGAGSYGMRYAASFYQNRLMESARSAQETGQTQHGQMWMARKAASPETPVQPVGAARPVSRDELSLPELTSRLENDPAAMAARMRMRQGGTDEEGRLGFSEEDGPVQGAKRNVLEGQLFKAEDALAKNDLKGAVNVLNGGAPKLPGLPEREDEKSAAVLPGQEEKDAEEMNGKAAQGVESAQEALKEGECQTCEERKYQDGSDDMGVSFQTPTNVKPEQAASAVRGHEMEHVYREQAKADREGRKVVSQSVTMHTGICPECGKSYVSGGTTRTVTKADTDNAVRQETARRGEENQKTRTPFSAVA